MKGTAKTWLLAFALGILLPGAVFSVAEKIYEDKISKESTAATGETIPRQTVPQGNGTELLAVLMQDGTVVEMDADTYLVGVVLGEMPTDFEEDALKAQAVVARTYALKRSTTGRKHPSGAVCTDSNCCQSYRAVADFLADGGTQEAVDKVTQAVSGTSNQVLTYNGALIDATYFSCSGGMTEDALAVWGTDIPYLQAVDSPGEEKATYYTDTVKFTAGEFADRLGISAKGLPATWLGKVTHTKGGGVDTMVIAGKTYGGVELREMLGLRSTAFTIYAVGESVHISTKGFGHRVGMSQYGAEAMAVGGSSYQEILSHYYPGTTIDFYRWN